MLKYMLAGAIAAVAFSAHAEIVTPTSPNWANPPGENGGGGSSSITGTAPRSGNGSLELFGDRTRFITGNHYDQASNLGSLSDVTGLSFDWQIASDSITTKDPDYTPALRLHVWDKDVNGNAFRTELIWEGAYNGVYGAGTDPGVWYSTNFASTFYRNGTSELDQRTITSWISAFSSNAYVSAISIGVGSTAGTDYHAFADNVVYGTKNGDTTYNFETAIPEPATWAMMIVGFGLAGSALRRRKGVALTA